MTNNKLNSSEFFKLISKVNDIIDNEIKKSIPLDFDKIISIQSDLQFKEVPYTNKEYKLIRNGKEANTIRVLTNRNDDFQVSVRKYENTSPFLSIVGLTEFIYQYIFDSYEIKNCVVYIEDRKDLLSYKDLGENVFLSNREFRGLFNNLIKEKRDNIWNIIREDINILMNNANTSNRALHISNTISKLCEIYWSI